MGDAVGGHGLVETGPIADGSGEGVIFEDHTHATTAQFDTRREDIVLGVDGLLFFLPTSASAV